MASFSLTEAGGVLPSSGKYLEVFMSAREGNPEGQRGLLRVREGIVVGSKMNKTVVVAVTRLVKHASYGKYIRRTRKYLVHDESDNCRVGDTVKISACRPLSKLKHWRVQEVVSRAVQL